MAKKCRRLPAQIGEAFGGRIGGGLVGEQVDWSHARTGKGLGLKNQLVKEETACASCGKTW